MDWRPPNEPKPTDNNAKNDGSKLLLFRGLPAASLGNYCRINEHHNILSSQSWWKLWLFSAFQPRQLDLSLLAPYMSGFSKLIKKTAVNSHDKFTLSLLSTKPPAAFTKHSLSPHGEEESRVFHCSVSNRNLTVNNAAELWEKCTAEENQ